jgi:hypothetical protein
MTARKPAKRTVDEYVASLTAGQREIVDALRELVRSAAPRATEVFKWAEPVYESNGPFAYIKAHKAHVTLGFWRGAELMQSSSHLETSGSKMAHIKIRTAADIPKADVRRLVQQATKLNAIKGNPATGR